MDDVKILLRYAFQTQNEVTLALQTSGTGGLEAALCNVTEPGETVILAVSGYWGQRMVEKAHRRNLDVISFESASGEIFTLEFLESQVAKFKPAALFVTHGESSSGTIQNLEGLGKMCHKYDCLLVVDAVVTLAGVPFYTDRWEIDVVVSGSQKAVGAPAGMALITMSPRAVDRMRRLKIRPPFYYDILDTCRHWNIIHPNRFYYITYSSHTLSALREALIEIVQEGLVERWKRHKMCAERFWTGIQKLGLKFLVEKVENRLLTVNCWLLPDEIVNRDVIDFLFEKYQVEPGFGITQTSKNGLRFGFMGYNARPEVVDYTLKALEESLQFCRNK